MHIGVIGYMILFPLVKIYKSIFVPLVQSGMVVTKRKISYIFSRPHSIVKLQYLVLGKKQTQNILSPQSDLEKYGPSC